jgi:hypothetical protein
MVTQVRVPDWGSNLTRDELPSLWQYYRKALRISREWLSRRTPARRATWECFVELGRQHLLLRLGLGMPARVPGRSN